MDIDEVIKSARVAKYSFTKGTYSLAKSNFDTISKKERVLLNDPDFWKKMFKNSETPGCKILKKYEAFKKNETIKLIDNQKELFSDLANKVYKYKIDVVKNDGFCADTERVFVEVFQKLLDDNNIHHIISE